MRPACRKGAPFILNSYGKAHSVPCNNDELNNSLWRKVPMLKKIAAFGLSAALVLSPLAAFAQADTTAPAAPGAAAPAPDAGTAKAKSTKHHKKHMSKKMKKPAADSTAAPAAAPAEAPK
jgi:hypothetical protein